MLFVLQQLHKIPSSQLPALCENFFIGALERPPFNKRANQLEKHERTGSTRTMFSSIFIALVINSTFSKNSGVPEKNKNQVDNSSHRISNAFSK